SDLVDWGRDGKHQFVYPVGSAVVMRLFNALHTAGSSRPALPLQVDHWQPRLKDLVKSIQTGPMPPDSGQVDGEIYELHSLFDNLEGKLDTFEKALARQPRTVDRARSESLETLARYAQQLALRINEILRGSTWADSPNAGIAFLNGQLVDLAT